MRRCLSLGHKLVDLVKINHYFPKCRAGRIVLTHTGNNRLFRLERRARTRRGGLLRFPPARWFPEPGAPGLAEPLSQERHRDDPGQGLRAGFEFVICHSLTSFNFGVLHKNER